MFDYLPFLAALSSSRLVVCLLVCWPVYLCEKVTFRVSNLPKTYLKSTYLLTYLCDSSANSGSSDSSERSDSSDSYDGSNISDSSDRRTFYLKQLFFSHNKNYKKCHQLTFFFFTKKTLFYQKTFCLPKNVIHQKKMSTKSIFTKNFFHPKKNFLEKKI